MDVAGKPPKPDLEITADRNNPATVSWLDACRKLDPCDSVTFESRVPYLIQLGLEMQAKIGKSTLN